MVDVPAPPIATTILQHKTAVSVAATDWTVNAGDRFEGYAFGGRTDRESTNESNDEDMSHEGTRTDRKTDGPPSSTSSAKRLLHFSALGVAASSDDSLLGAQASRPHQAGRSLGPLPHLLPPGTAPWLSFRLADAVPTGRVAGPHFSPGGVSMAPEFSSQRVLASEGRSGDTIRASMCALRGKGQARARPALSVVAGPLNSTNQGAENKPLFTMHAASW